MVDDEAFIKLVSKLVRNLNEELQFLNSFR